MRGQADANTAGVGGTIAAAAVEQGIVGDIDVAEEEGEEEWAKGEKWEEEEEEEEKEKEEEDERCRGAIPRRGDWSTLLMLS